MFDGMYKLLEFYSNKKIILTNANEEQMLTYGLINLPYTIFTLKHSPDKTDPEYFKKMLKKFKLNKEDVVYIEHDKNAVKSAESLGIVSFYYDQNKKNLEKLKIFLNKNT